MAEMRPVVKPPFDEARGRAPETHTFPLSRGHRQWSEVSVSNHRLELSVAISDDDGKTWTALVVIARTPRGWLAYPYLFEARPGELWITTMQGELLRQIDSRNDEPAMLISMIGAQTGVDLRG